MQLRARMAKCKAALNALPNNTATADEPGYIVLIFLLMFSQCT